LKDVRNGCKQRPISLTWSTRIAVRFAAGLTRRRPGRATTGADGRNHHRALAVLAGRL